MSRGDRPSSKGELPPGLARRLLLRLAHPDRRDEVANDLDEWYRRQRRRRGRPMADLRYWLELLGIVRWRLRSRAAAMPAPPAISPGRGRARAMLDGLRLDLRYGARSLLRQPGYSVVAVLTVALGVAVSTAMFTLLNAVVIRPLDLGPADRILRVSEALPSGDLQFASGPLFEDIRRLASRAGEDDEAPLEEIAAFQYQLPVLRTPAGPQQIAGARVSPWFFDMLDVRPLHGRDLVIGDAIEGNRVVMLSERLWEREFGGDPDLVGGSVTLAKTPHQVVGIVPGDVDLPNGGVDLWLPLSLDAAPWMRDRSVRPFQLWARMASGVSSVDATTALDDVASRIAERHPDTNRDVGVRVTGLQDTLVGDVSRRLWLMLGAVVMVLLIACANVANLALARTLGRRGELATHVALGAARSRVLRRLYLEQALVAVLGGVLGVLAVAATLDVLRSLVPSWLPRVDGLAVEPRVLGFAAIAIAVCTLISGLGAIPASRPNRVAGTEGRFGAARNRTRSILLVAEVALSLVLVVGAVLFLRSLGALSDVDLGFDTRSVSTFRVSLPGGRDQEASRELLTTRILEGVAGVPGVEAVAATSQVPLSGQSMMVELSVRGGDQAGPRGPRGGLAVVSPGYLETLNVALLGGRPLRESDGVDRARVALVNQTAARRWWPGREAVGGQVALHDQLTQQGEAAWIEIVGVVSDSRSLGPTEEVVPEIYIPYRQAGEAWGWIANSIGFLVRGEGAGSLSETQLRRLVTGIDSSVPVHQATTLEALLRASSSDTRFLARLLGVFAILAVALAAVGLYGVLSFSVQQRRHEIGVRLALGARRQRVRRQIVTQGLCYSLIGMAIGLPLAVAVTRLLTHLLHGVAPLDPGTYLASILVVALASLGACWVPARRGASVDPVRALRPQ